MNENGSMTAKLCLFARAIHAQEDHPVFNDTKAEELLEKKDYDWFSKRTQPVGEYDERLICRQVDCYFSPILTSRSAFAEEHVMNFGKRNGRIQYVILGAGMDTFAFRNQYPQIEIFELDHPYTQNYKIKRIHELGWKIPEHVNYIPVDFTKDDIADILKDTTFDQKVPTVFSILGLTYYLSSDTFSAMLETISSLAKKEDEVIFDYPDPSGFQSSSDVRMKRLSKVTESLGETMQKGFTTDEIITILKNNHLHVKEHMAPADIEGRWFQNDERIRAFPCIHLMLAEK